MGINELNITKFKIYIMWYYITFIIFICCACLYKNMLIFSVKNMGVVPTIYLSKNMLINWVRNKIVIIFHTGESHFDKTYHIITYYKGAEQYCIKYKRNKLIPKIETILDEENKNVIHDVKKFMGPYYNFHNINTTPTDLGYKKLTFVMYGDTRIFNESDPIKFI